MFHRGGLRARVSERLVFYGLFGVFAEAAREPPPAASPGHELRLLFVGRLSEAKGAHRGPSVGRHHHIAMSGPVAAALRHLKLELVVWAVHTRTLIKRRGDLKALAGHGDLRLHLGCGDRLKAGWVNIDIHPAADLRLDLRRPWPLPDGCACEVYAEHLFEHLARPGEADHLLREARRVLRTGGTLRLSVPDLARHVGAYVARNAEFRAAFAPFLPAEAVTWGDALNHHFRQNGEHLYVYDAETLEARLRAAGFVEPRVVPSSRDYEQPARDFESLVMVARNP